MQNNNVHHWVMLDEKRRKILMSMKQPLTARQIGRKTGISIDTCSYILMKLSSRGLVLCMNPKAKSCRLYWVSDLGRKFQERIRKEEDLPETPLKAYTIPRVSWELYGWVCFKHRAAVIKAMSDPLQPAEIKKVLRIHNPRVKISANNIRDIMRLFLARRVVRKVFARNKAHPRYELTRRGVMLRKLLFQADMPS